MSGSHERFNLMNDRGQIRIPELRRLAEAAHAQGSVFQTVGDMLQCSSGTLYDPALTARRNPIVRIYTANDVWTNPTGLDYAEIECVGGGGGGGGTNALNATATYGRGGGGACGGYVRWKAAATLLTPTVAVTVGAAGIGGSNTPNAGGTGGDTTFGGYLKGAGGGGGQLMLASTTVAVAVGGVVVIGSGGDINTAGAPGTDGLVLFDSSTSTYAQAGGQGGSGIYGAGGSSSSRFGQGFGAGGGGGNGTNLVQQTGGNGAPGVLIVREWYLQS